MVRRLYSLHGCTACKQRKKKCDERKPVCGACTRLKLPCITAPAPKAQTLSQVEAQRTAAAGDTPTERLTTTEHALPLPPLRLLRPLRQQADPSELLWLGHFFDVSLPIIAACQPQVKWKITLQFYMHVVPAFRSIAIAISMQHERLRTQPCSQDFVIKTNLAYQHAVAMWRTTFDCWSLTSLQWIITGCILMVQLESMRGSSAGLRVHLALAVKMLNEAKSEHASLSEVTCLLGLLQALCSSVLLHQASPVAAKATKRTATFASEDFVLASAIGAAVPADDQQYLVQSLISKFVSAQVRGNEYSDDGSWRTTGRIQSQTRMDQRTISIMRTQVLQDDLTTAHELAIAASVVTLDLMANSAFQYGDRVIDGASLSYFQLILTSIHRCITRIKADAKVERLPFVLGLDIVHKLELVLMASDNPLMREQAYRLLKNDLIIEQSWSADRILQNLTSSPKHRRTLHEGDFG